MPGDFHCCTVSGYAFLKFAYLAHLNIPLLSPFLLTRHSSVGRDIRKGNYITYMRYEVFHISVYEEYYLRGCTSIHLPERDTMQSGKSSAIFQRNETSPSSGLKTKLSTQQA